jgi:hypothetical protein
MKKKKNKKIIKKRDFNILAHQQGLISLSTRVKASGKKYNRQKYKNSKNWY